MPKASKFSPDEGLTIYDLKDSEAVHYGNQSKGYVGKNLLPNTAVNATIQQVLFTINADKSVKINGTNSGNENVFEVGHVSLKAGKYIVTGTGFGSNNLAIQITDYPITKQLYRIYSGDTEITLENDTTICYRIVISASQAYSNFVVYPMLRLASIPDSTYEPWYMSNRELTNIAGIITRETSDLDSNSDMDDAKTMGIYGLKGVTSHIPAGESALWGFLLVLVRGDGAIFQFVIASQKIFVRYFSGSWQSWYKYQGILAT